MRRGYLTNDEEYGELSGRRWKSWPGMELDGGENGTTLGTPNPDGADALPIFFDMMIPNTIAILFLFPIFCLSLPLSVIDEPNRNYRMAI